ncbi:MarR family transcriptional regulator [uncultured Desulfobacter sp.]|uniref:MarR family winged helix-turn-helix transcriptional regulator n=1 Tax=uncultured Desulfobacter sp. TaxID=240139 RepID=UPI0029C844B7|nr:MarR family transcriptional regulator [uncultured Desulfobacter sp.]
MPPKCVTPKHNISLFTGKIVAPILIFLKTQKKNSLTISALTISLLNKKTKVIMKYKKADKPLMHLFMHIGKLLNDRLRTSLDKGGIHFGQARVLTALMEHKELTQGLDIKPATVTNMQRMIGEGLDIKPATVTNMVKRMEASKLIERRRDINDDRIIIVTLTAKGKKAAEFALTVMAQIEDDIRSELSQKDVDTLRTPLEKVRNVLGGSDPSL